MTARKTPTRGGARKGAGRPSLGRTVAVLVRLTPEERAELDAWAEREDGSLARMLVERGLRAARRPASPGAR